MKIYYFNDSKRPINIYVDGIGEENFIKTLGGVEGAFIKVYVPNGFVPFIKNWGSYVMISAVVKPKEEDYENYEEENE